MLSKQRKEEIRILLLRERSVIVNDLAARFQVSTETIRRDLSALEEEGVCVKSYGGATLIASQLESASATRTGYPIAQVAASLIQPHDCVFLDHSSSIWELVEFIPDFPITVVTNSLVALNALQARGNISLIATGGNYNQFFQGFFGDEAIRFVQTHHFDKAFISCRTVHPELGIYDSIDFTAALHAAVAEASSECYVMVSRNKMNGEGFCKALDFNRLTGIITNAETSPSWQASLKEQGLHVYTAI